MNYWKLILQGNFKEAQRELEKLSSHTLKIGTLTSLLYQLNNEYEKEKNLIEKLISLNPENQYLKERVNWHKLTKFQQMEPRPPITVERNPNNIPAQKILKELTFVTGGDSAYFEVMYELIESIKATTLYNNIPINIIDCGLKDSEKNQLYPLLSGGEILDPGWKYPIKEIYSYHTHTKTHKSSKPQNAFKGVVAKPFLSTLFPNYEYYFWINPNFWIQDERSLDQFINLCTRQGIAAANHNDYEVDTPINNHCLAVDIKDYLTPQQVHTIKDSRIFWDGIFCVKKSTGFFNKWQDNVQRALQRTNNKFYYNMAEFLATFTAHDICKEYIDKKWISYHYLPFIYQNNIHEIYKPQKDPLSLIVNYISNHDITIDQTVHEPYERIGIVRPIRFHDYNHSVFIIHKTQFSKTILSTRYRTQPWKNKENIKNTLIKEAKNNEF